MYKDVTGIILAGGKSTRMGENKSFLKIDGEPVVGRILKLMLDIFENVIIITNTPSDYEFLNVPVYTDIYKYHGPLAGIHSGLLNSSSNQNFIISVDMPLMTRQMIKFIVDFPTSKPITVCNADGFIQQLAGRFSKSVHSNAEKLLKDDEEELRNSQQFKRKCKVLSLLDSAGAEIIDAASLEFYEEGLFYNMNRREDYKFILSKLKNV